MKEGVPVKVKCPCGAQYDYEKAEAGQTVTCECGAAVAFPPLPSLPPPKPRKVKSGPSIWEKLGTALQTPLTATASFSPNEVAMAAKHRRENELARDADTTDAERTMIAICVLLGFVSVAIPLLMAIGFELSPPVSPSGSLDTAVYGARHDLVFMVAPMMVGLGVLFWMLAALVSIHRWLRLIFGKVSR